MRDLYADLKLKEKEVGLCRLIAGYAWEWKSAGVNEDSVDEIFDIELDNLQFKWNSEAKDWINSPNAINEIGCIHTTQGYDLNYAGVIFGWEIDYNPFTQKIEIDRDKYYDKYGKIGVSDQDTLREYIINIYKTILFRGIRGTYIYACNSNLRSYLKRHITTYNNYPRLSLLAHDIVEPYINAIPIYDLKVAAGNFSPLQQVEDYEWVAPPSGILANENYFVCQVVGTSMNKVIPDGAWCLFGKIHRWVSKWKNRTCTTFFF